MLPVLRPYGLDIRDGPARSRAESPLHAIQGPTPGELRVDAIIGRFCMLCESDLRLGVREDVATVALFVDVEKVVIVHGWGLVGC